MISKVRVVKKQKLDEVMPTQPQNIVKTQQQRNREMAGVVEGWIDEFKIHSASKYRAALLFMNK